MGPGGGRVGIRAPASGAGRLRLAEPLRAGAGRWVVSGARVLGRRPLGAGSQEPGAESLAPG